MCLPCVVELVEVDVASAILVEEAEDDLVLGVGFREQVLEDTPIVDIDSSLPLAVCNLEQDAVLVALDFVLMAGAPLASPCFSTLTHCRRNCLRSLRSQVQQPR